VLIRAHLLRYPRLQLADAWKLMQHAAAGAAHAAAPLAAVTDSLHAEAASLGAPDGEPLLDPLGDAGARFCRVHLRPYLAAGGALDRLADAFLSGLAEPVTPGAVPDAAASLLAATRGGILPWSPDSCAAYLEKQRRDGFPPVAHSDTYRAAYRPAYRVLPARLARELVVSLR
jgi:hypothetical protein